MLPDLSASGSRDTAPRIATAFVGLPLLVMVVWAGSPWVSLMAGAAAALGALELCRMFGQPGRRPVAGVAALWGITFVAVAHLLSNGSSAQVAFSVAAATAIAVGLAGLALARPIPAVADWGITAGSAIYPGGFLAYAPLIREVEQGLQWLIVALVVTFANDSAAYFVGSAIGKTPLAPKISVGKTWEGSIAGAAGALAAAGAALYVFGLDVALAWMLALGAGMAVAAQLGDLAESWLKRITGVKDSGGIMPGHGGLLDRLDSIVLNLVLVYYFVIWVAQ